MAVDYSGLVTPAMADATGPKGVDYGSSNVIGAIGSPAFGGALGVLGLIGGGLNAWLTYKDKKAQEKKEEQRYREEMEMSAKRYEQQMLLEQQRLNMSRAQMLANMRQQKESNDQYYDERNYARSNTARTSMMQLLGMQQRPSRLQTIYGG